jgi:choline/glycine/proline betaine transport protein
VIDSITSGGKLDAPVGQRIFWAVSEGAVAATLLIGGGLAALQTAALTSGLPFTIILLLMCYSLFLGLREAQEEIEERKKRRDRESYQKVISNLLQERKEKKS